MCCGRGGKIGCIRSKVAICKVQFKQPKCVVSKPKIQVRQCKMAPAQFISGINIQTSPVVLSCPIEVPQCRVFHCTPRESSGVCAIVLDCARKVVQCTIPAR